MLLASPVGQPSRIKAYKTKAIVWGWHTLHIPGWEFVAKQLPDVGRPLTAVCLCVLGWVTDAGQRGFSASTGFMNDAACSFVHAGFLRGSKNPRYVEVGMMTCAEVAFYFFHFKVTVGGAREGRGGILCWASFEKHCLVWLLRLQHTIGIPFYRTGESCWTSSRGGEYPDKCKKEMMSV